MFNDNSGSGGSGEQSKYLNHTFLGLEPVIYMINRSAMEDLAYKYVYGCEVPRDIRRPMMWVIAHQAKYKAHPTAEKLNVLVRAANDCTRPVARKHIKRAADLKLITEEREGRKVIYSLDPDQEGRARLIVKLTKAIDRAVAAQAANPTDLRAGAEHVPAEVYYHLADVAAFAEQQVDEPAQEDDKTKKDDVNED